MRAGLFPKRLFGSGLGGRCGDVRGQALRLRGELQSRFGDLQGCHPGLRRRRGTKRAWNLLGPLREGKRVR